MSFLSRIFGASKNASLGSPAQIYFTNTLDSKKELFIAMKPGVVAMYSCGPTVYNQAHIGNLRAYVFSDTIARTLEDAGYHVRRVINITDVGHLVGDGDEGEDKMNVGAEREHKTPKEIADRYTKLFVDDLVALNIDTSDILFPRATEYISQQIALAKTLEEKGFAYRLPEGLYFDTAKFAGYGKLGGVNHAELEGGRRVDTKGKRHPADFALWRAAKPHDLQQWDSPWGRGNPGWHIECSAMIRTLLGQEIDIHTGGEDHIAVHHNNEIAQSEAATGRPFVRYWIHGAFLTMGGEKASKSLGNVVYLPEISAKGIHPLALRYFFLQAHYRTPLSFTWDALLAANGALMRLWRTAYEIGVESKKKSASSEALNRFVLFMRDDLGTPQALGLLWDTLKSEEFSLAQKWALVEKADALLGLSLVEPPDVARPVRSMDIPQNVQSLLEKREAARKSKDFASADALRADIEKSGYHVEDSPSGPVLTREAP